MDLKKFHMLENGYALERFYEKCEELREELPPDSKGFDLAYGAKHY